MIIYIHSVKPSDSISERFPRARFWVQIPAAAGGGNLRLFESYAEAESWAREYFA